MKFKGDVLIIEQGSIIRNDSEYKDLINMPKLPKSFDGDNFIIYNRDMELWEQNNEDDWEKCEFGVDMQYLGIDNYLTTPTLNGNWNCKVINTENNKTIGNIITDSEMIGIFLLDEVFKYNKNFDMHINDTKYCTLINNFDGNIEISLIDEIIEINGYGNINFNIKK